MTWSPLACGIISGKYDSGVPPYSRASLKVLRFPSAPLFLTASSLPEHLCRHKCPWCFNGCVRVFQVLALGVFPCRCVCVWKYLVVAWTFRPESSQHFCFVMWQCFCGNSEEDICLFNANVLVHLLHTYTHAHTLILSLPHTHNSISKAQHCVCWWSGMQHCTAVSHLLFTGPVASHPFLIYPSPSVW